MLSSAPREPRLDYAVTMIRKRTLLSLSVLVLLAACDAKKATPTGTASSAAKAGDAKPTLVAPSTPIKAGQPLPITWTGPNGPDDYIDLVASGRTMQVGDEISYAKTAAGNPAKLTAPPTPGTYDVRYVQDHGGRTVIGHIAITVVK